MSARMLGLVATNASIVGTTRRASIVRGGSPIKEGS
jgi:hypothetical protein